MSTPLTGEAGGACSYTAAAAPSHAGPYGKPLIPTLGAGTMQLNQTDRKQAAITVCGYICWVPLH